MFHSKLIFLQNIVHTISITREKNWKNVLREIAEKNFILFENAWLFENFC